MSATNFHLSLLRSKEAQQALGIGATTLYKWCRQGLLTPIKFSRRCTRFKASEVHALIAAHAAPASKGVSHE